MIKNFFDGFYQTNFDTYLKSKKIENIYLCGINTEVCVFQTAISASVRGYNVFVVADITKPALQKNQRVFLNYLNWLFGVNLINLNDIIN